MPLTLVDFYGRYKGKTILSWRTEREINTKYFILEKSFDQISFKPLTNVAATGSARNNRNYQYIDSTPSTINYYRLKMVDIEGRFTSAKQSLLPRPLSVQFLFFQILQKINYLSGWRAGRVNGNNNY